MSSDEDHHDADWEFNAPRFVDFEQHLEDSKIDMWFDSEEAAHLEHLDQGNTKRKREDSIVFQPRTPQQQKKFKYSTTPQMNIVKTPKFQLAYADEYDTGAEERDHRHATPKDMVVEQQKRLQYTPRKLLEKIRKAEVPKLTIPKTPTFMSEARIKSRHERTANMEKPASTKKRYSNARRHGHTHIGRSHPSMMARPTLKVPRTLTQPVEFTFQTESRARDHHQHEEPEEHETQKQWQPVLTHPQPFKLHESRIKPCDTTTYNSPYKSTAERLKEFDTTMKLHETIVASKPLELTQPVPFNLQTSSRHRPVHVLSTEEQMRIAIENQPKFKARPFPQRIVATHGDLGVPKVEKRPLTEPSEFNLRSLQRLENRKRKRTEEEEALIEQNRERKRQFKARALNARVLAGQSDLPPVEPRPITVPQSPALSTKQRGLAHKEQLAARAKILEEAQEEARKFRARPLPEDKPFQLAPKPTQLTDPAPFTLSTEARGATYVQTMQEKVRQEEREERARREFKAQPVKVFDDTKYGHVENKPLTEPIPFNLQTDARGEVRAEQHSHYDHKNENYVFKARPMPITKPFALAKSDKPLTELSNVELRSDRRALQRSEFDERMKKKMIAIEEMQRQRQEEEERQEAEQREQLRRDIEAGLKAKPLPAFYDTYSKDPVSLTEKRLKRRLNQQRSKLTIPKTPNFATNKRMGKRESTRLR